MILFKDQDINVRSTGKDGYGSTLDWLIIKGATVNYDMVKAGFAWWYEYYCPGKSTVKTKSVPKALS